MKLRAIILFSWLATAAFAQQETVKKFVNDPANQKRWLTEYAAFLAIPNVLGDSINIERNASYISHWLTQLGVKTELLRSGSLHSAPVVFGEVNVPGATKTLAFYAHYDGQPVNPKQWADGLQPFVPHLFTDRLDRGGKEIQLSALPATANPQWRLYARGAADDKAGVFSIITAYEALIKNGIAPTVNIKFFFEGEEEAGSPTIGQVFQTYKEKLKADLWVICDGPRHVSGKKLVNFGVRGDVNLDLTVYTAIRPLHSGNYGNWAPNPAMRLAQILASMKDADGKIVIEGFYDDCVPLTEFEKSMLRKVPRIEGQLMDELALARPDGKGRAFTDLLMLPTLNVNGMQSGNVGAMASNVIPTEATAVLDLRLVLGNDVDRQVQKVIRHIEKLGYVVIDHDPSEAERRSYPMVAKVKKRGAGYNAQRTPMDLPIAQQVVAAIQSTVNYDVIKVPSLGGSLPLFIFEKELGAKPITVPVVNYDTNQHAENENVMIGFLWEGVETMAAVMTMKP